MAMDSASDSSRWFTVMFGPVKASSMATSPADAFITVYGKTAGDAAARPPDRKAANKIYRVLHAAKPSAQHDAQSIGTIAPQRGILARSAGQ